MRFLGQQLDQFGWVDRLMQCPHAYHTHEALHEAAHAITMLIETFRTEAAALITTSAHGTDIPTQRRQSPDSWQRTLNPGNSR